MPAKPTYCRQLLFRAVFLGILQNLLKTPHRNVVGPVWGSLRGMENQSVFVASHVELEQFLAQCRRKINLPGGFGRFGSNINPGTGYTSLGQEGCDGYAGPGSQLRARR